MSQEVQNAHRINGSQVWLALRTPLMESLRGGELKTYLHLGKYDSLD